MSTSLWYVPDGDGARIADARQWSAWRERNSVHIADETLGGVRVSTVFLGLDHRFEPGGEPVLWETMVFGGLLDGEMMRYTSRPAAVLGHAAVVAAVRLHLEASFWSLR